MRTKCKYCLKPLDENGYCSKPCKIGALVKKLDELKRRTNK